MSEAARLRRRLTHQRGLRAETVAAAFLMLKGYRILARRHAGAGGEIDIVARRGQTIAFVEVKARGAMDDALTAISATKRTRFGRAARHWLARNPWAMELTLRGDAIFIAPRRWPRHVPDAVPLTL